MVTLTLTRARLSMLKSFMLRLAMTPGAGPGEGHARVCLLKSSMVRLAMKPGTRGLHSSTFQLTLSRF